MKTEIEIWRTNRAIYSKFLKHNSEEILNKIPTNFNNNLIWNIGHVIAVQQHLTYKKSGLPMHISEEFFEKYKPGTKPEEHESPAQIQRISELLISTTEQTIADFKAKKFKFYDEFTTSKGFHVSSAKAAVSFNNYHEALHLGNMSSMLKFLL